MIGFDGEKAERERTELGERTETLVDLDDEIALTPVTLCTDAEHGRAHEPAVVSTGRE